MKCGMYDIFLTGLGVLLVIGLLLGFAVSWDREYHKPDFAEAYLASQAKDPLSFKDKDGKVTWVLHDRANKRVIVTPEGYEHGIRCVEQSRTLGDLQEHMEHSLAHPEESQTNAR